jgi:hypothetical protein
MDYEITHGPEGPWIVFTISPQEAAAIHADMRATLHTSADYDAFDRELNHALRATNGRSYRKGEN